MRNGLLLLLMILGVTPGLALAAGEPAAKPRQITASAKNGKEWMRAMEASVVHADPIPPISMKMAAAWTGWGMAILCFFYVLIVQWRARKRSEFLMRAGERDDFLIRRRF